MSLYVLVEREFKLMFRSRMMALLVLAQPVIMIFLFALSMSGVVGELPYRGATVSYLEFMVPSVVILTLIFISMMMSQSVFNEKMSNMLTILLATRIRVRDYILGKLLANTSISLLQAFIMLTVYVAIVQVWDAILILNMIPTVALASLAIAGLYLTLLGYLKTITAFSTVVNLATLVMFYSAPLFYPIEAIPFPLNLLSYINPVTYLVESARQSYLLGYYGFDFIVSFALAILFSFTAVYTMRRMVTEM